MTDVTGEGELRTTADTVIEEVHIAAGPNDDGVRRELTCSKIDGMSIFEGDIVVNQGLTAMGVGITGMQYRWPNKTVVYLVRDDLPRPERVRQAMEHWEERTEIRFKERTNESDYVVFRPGGGCSSAVGRRGGVQFITLGSGCSVGNTIHEIGHTVGLWHEQSREDRDQFIEVKWDNIDDLYAHNFKQHIRDGDDLGAYDYASIMHYPRGAFAIDRTKPTLVTPNGEAIGQRDALSEGDIAAVAEMYP